ncbi:MAG: DUF559 domain-containing protein [Gammaproteobacteria bacterium]|nr:DUF559 domain-containing protein [Gammaproteobacteria bacterium]
MTKEARMPNVPSKLLNNVRQLRREQTDTENYLWQILRDRQLLGFSFAVNMPSCRTSGFYCHEAGLVIELDGSQHADSVGKDKCAKNFWNPEAYKY